MKIENQIQQNLQQLDPVVLDVVNESHMHSVPPDSETHFKVTLVSDLFIDKPLVARHRMVNALLEEQLSGGVHALALHTKTPDEWFDQGGQVPDSPKCAGGSKKSGE